MSSAAIYIEDQDSNVTPFVTCHFLELAPS